MGLTYLLLRREKKDKKRVIDRFFINFDMHEIKCPECGSSIRMDSDKYSKIIKQVRDKEFEGEITKRHELLEIDKQKSIDIAVQNMRLQMQESSFSHEKKIQALQSKIP